MEALPAAGDVMDALFLNSRRPTPCRLAACLFLLMSPPVSGATAPAEDQPGTVAIEMPVFEGGEGLSFFLNCARAYEKIRPDVKVNLYGDPRIADKVRVRILEGTFPEITNATLNYWALIKNGEIQPLDESLDGPNWEGDSTWRESFLPGSLDRYTYEGKVYGMPFLYSPVAVWYNKAMFEEHGWGKPRTWDEMYALCEKIEEAGIARLAFQGRYPGYCESMISSAYYHLAGSERFEEQNNLAKGSYNNPEMIEALGLVRKLAMDHFQKGAMGMSHTESQMQFFLGNTAMIVCGSWLKSEMLGKIPEGFRLGGFNLPLPVNSKADPTALYAYPAFYFVMKKSPHVREAVDFLRFMTSREQAGNFCRERDIICAVKGSADGNVSEDLAELVEMINAARVNFGSAVSTLFPDMDQYLNNAYEPLLTGKKTPEMIAEELEEGAEQVRNLLANPDAVTVRHRWKPALLIGLIVAAIIYWGATTTSRIAENRRLGRFRGTAGRLKMSWPNVVLFVGPAALAYTVFVIIPGLKSFSWSLHEWNGLTDMTFKGLLHFRRLLTESDAFWTALDNNLFLMFVVPLFVLPLSLFLAACISRGIKGAAFFKIVFFFPNILGVVADTLLWMHMYNPQGGVVNSALVGFGTLLSEAGPLAPVGEWLVKTYTGFAWLSSEHLYWAIIPMSIWGACGFNMILFLAAMEGVPQEIYEAAEIDGASPWRQFWTITIPLIWDVLSIAVVFMVIAGMKAFEVIWLLTNQRPTTDQHVIGTQMMQSMFTEFRVGQATAIAVVLFLLVFFGSAATLRLLKRDTVQY
jgi:raffinose/stachyose/melibiose transport system permease protein